MICLIGIMTLLSVLGSMQGWIVMSFHWITRNYFKKLVKDVTEDWARYSIKYMDDAIVTARGKPKVNDTIYYLNEHEYWHRLWAHAIRKLQEFEDVPPHE